MWWGCLREMALKKAPMKQEGIGCPFLLRCWYRDMPGPTRALQFERAPVGLVAPHYPAVLWLPRSCHYPAVPPLPPFPG